MSDAVLPIAISLDGDWQLGWFDGRRGDRAFRDRPPDDRRDWLVARVPGELHRALEAQGILDPIEDGAGALAARWVDDNVWYLIRDVTLTANDLRASVDIVFERLDLDARVFINGVPAASHRNAFLPLRATVGHLLVEGRNTIRVELNGGSWSVSDLPATGYRHSADQGLTKRHWLRTGQSQFGWDWSPRLVTVGITGHVRLELRSIPIRIDQVVPVVHVSEDLATATVSCRVVVASAAPARVDGRLHVAVQGLQLHTSQAITLAPGLGVHIVQLVVDRPPLWWPRGMGEQHLHQLTVRLEIGDTTVDTAERTIGFRSVEVDRRRLPDGGTLFRLVVNGRPFFAKGANWVPVSLTPNPVDGDLLDRLLDRAVEANFTFLRVWGGGDYESEAFYRGCDERGILVWQDFIFACSRYPMSYQSFVTEAIAEVTYQVRRLSSHASLAVWAGNNEIAWIGLSPGWPGPLVLGEDGVTHAELEADHAFFERELPAILDAEDPTRFYQPSSPWSPTSPDHNAFEEGDQHPWQVGFEDVDFLRYRDMDARFPNEGGLLGPTSMPAITASLPDGQRYYGSFAWKLHDNQVAQAYADRPMRRLLLAWTGVDIEDVSLEAYAYWSGLVQGEALTEYIDNFRRRSRTTGAAVFWMYNDCWPAVRSWSIVDHRARRNPSFFAVKRAFAPVRIVLVAAADGADVYGCNDESGEWTGELEFGIASLAGEVETVTRSVRLPSGGATLLAQVPRPAGDPHAVAFIALLRKDGHITSRGRLLAGPFAALPWLEPVIDIHRSALTVTFVSPVFVLGVCLDLDGEATLDDNFFDLYPGIPHTIAWDLDRPPTVLFTGNGASGIPIGSDRAR
jgi:beta-mannosidase